MSTYARAAIFVMLVATVANAGHRDLLYSPERRLIAETAVTTGTQPVIEEEYIWFGDRPVAQFDGTTQAVRWSFSDHVRTPVLQTGSGGAVVWRMELEPYGRKYEQRDGAALRQPLRFPGQEADPDAPGRYYNQQRWYAPDRGRYTQSDPIGFQGGINLYRYGNDNPLSNIDPLGLACQSGRCADCPDGVWYSGAGVAEGSMQSGPFALGGIVFAGIMICPSNPYFNVPFVTICAAGLFGNTYPSKGFQKPGTHFGGAGIGGGVAGGAIRCSGFPCREDLEGDEDGTLVQIGPVWGFHEGTASGGSCTGVGGGPDVGLYVGSFACRTYIGKSIGGHL